MKMTYFNNDFFRKMKGKLKIMKEKKLKKLVVLSLSFSLLLSGCGVFKNEKSGVSITNPNTNTYYQENTSNSNAVSNQKTEVSTPVETPSDLSEEDKFLLDQNVSISEQDYSNFFSYVHSIPVDYQNSEYFQIDQALNKYQNIKEYETVSSNFIKDGRIDEEALKQQVLKNNNEYFANKKSGKYSLLDSVTFDKVFTALIDTLNYNLQSGTNIDIAQLDDNLTNLKIFRMTSSGSGMVTDDAILAVNLEVIATRQLEYPNVDYLRMTAIHEGNHLVQASSVKERTAEGYSKNVGIAYAWNDLAVNPLLYTWYTESSAEYLKYYQYGEGAETSAYENQVKALEALTFTTILKDGTDETTLAKVSLQPDLNELFTIFNCQTNQDKMEVLNMMYALEICLNQPSEFTKFYKEKTGKNLDLYNYQDSLKTSIAETLTKKFYENLATHFSGKSGSLKEAFSLMATFELEMSRFTKYSNDYYIDTNESFLEMYKDIQNEYFAMLSTSLNRSVEELNALYSTYYHDGISSSNQANLNQGASDFINRLLQSRTDSRKYAINEITVSKTK